MKKLAVLFLAMALALVAMPAMAQNSEPVQTFTDSTDWGNMVYGANGNGAIINVKDALTNGKQGMSQWFTEGDFGKITKDATEQAKKLLTQIYAIDGVASVRFSTYQIIVQKGDLFDFPGELKPDIFKAMDGWYAAVSKKPPAKTDKKE